MRRCFRGVLAAVLLSTVWAASAQAEDLLLHGTIAPEQSDSYVMVPFEVPPDVRQMDISFSYQGRHDYATLDLGIEDPQRFRGWSGGNKDAFSIGVQDATRSYLPGPLPAGSWHLIIGVAWLSKGHSSSYEARIHLVRNHETSSVEFAKAPLATGARWYRGDLHLHTAHSDGSCASQSGKTVPCPMFVSVEEAARHGLDFLAITDHNTASHYDEERELQPYFDKLLLIPGREMTTYSGHANIWGTTEVVDFRTGDAARPSKNAMLKQARDLDAVVSINHPVGPDDERCIGCGWIVGDTDMHLVSAIEVANGPSDHAGAYFRAPDIAFWDDQLRRGFHLTAVGGSDTHQPDLDTIGLPTTVVFAEELSVASILNGIRAGHVFIDLTGSRTLPAQQQRLLELTGSSGTGHATMGDILAVHSRESIVITAHVAGSYGSSLRMFVDGAPEALLPDSTVTSMEQTKTLSLSPTGLAAGKPHWIRAEVHGPDGSLQLLSNPIYLEVDSH
jgi:hypothetical protein